MVTSGPQRSSLQKEDKDSGRYERDCNPIRQKQIGATIALHHGADLHITVLPEPSDDRPWCDMSYVRSCSLNYGHLIWPTRQWYLGVAGVVPVVRNSPEAIDLRRIQVLQKDLTCNFPWKPTLDASSNSTCRAFFMGSRHH